MSDDVVVLFPETTRIREAMAIVNHLEPKKLKVVLGRLSKAIGVKTSVETTVFSESERVELLEHLHLNSSELETLLGACSFIFEQSAYHLVKPADLVAQLQVLGMAEPQVKYAAYVSFSKIADIFLILSKRRRVLSVQRGSKKQGAF